MGWTLADLTLARRGPTLAATLVRQRILGGGGGEVFVAQNRRSKVLLAELTPSRLCKSDRLYSLAGLPSEKRSRRRRTLVVL